MYFSFAVKIIRNCLLNHSMSLYNLAHVLWGLPLIPLLFLGSQKKIKEVYIIVYP
jgi:hypothetical protein